MPPNRQSSLIVASFAAAIGIIAAVGTLAFFSLQSAMDADNWYAHTWEVLRAADVVLIGMTDAETGQRGYLLTGEPSYLQTYEEAGSSVPRDLAALRQLTSDNQPQQERCSRLAVLITAKFAEIKSTIELYRAGRGAEALEVVKTSRGQKVMEEVRQVVLEMEQEENGLLVQRLNLRNQERRQASRLVLGGNILAALLVAGAALALARLFRREQRALRARQESEQRLIVTLNSIGDAVIATNTDGAVLYTNPVAQQMTGWTEADARGQPLDEVFHIVNEETRRTVEHPVEKVLRTGAIVGLANHTVLISRDGREIPIDDSAAPIQDGGGAIMGVVLVFRDVSERRQAQDSRELYLLAETANRAKDDFLAVLSHELRSPLNAMLGWVRLLRQNGTDKKIFDRAVEVLDRNIAMQTKLINDLLDMSRIISGKLKLELEPLDLVSLVSECADSSRPAAEAKGLRLKANLPSGRAVPVMADGERLHQALCNLLDNAIKFTPSGGEIELSLDSRDGAARVVVADTGQGIPADFLPYAFERFRQADAGASRAHGGLGIGLAIVRHVVEGHGGKVTADSEGGGRGARFSFSIPEATSHREQVAVIDNAAATSPVRAISVLLVEDDVYTLEALKIALEQSGATVFATTTGGEALAIFDREQPTVLISDISMPGMSGYDLIRAIRSRDGKHTLAAAMTGLASSEDRDHALEAGFDEYLTKPIDPEVLIQFIRNHRAE